VSPNLAEVKLSRKEQKAATRTAIKSAARTCFFTRGYETSGIADIAKTASVAHGTFYVHFANKAEVLDELLVEFNDGLAAKLQPLFASAGGDLVTTVRHSAEIFLDYWHGERDFVECYAQRSAAGIDPISLRDGVNPPMVNLLSAALTMVAARRGASPGDWELITQGVLALWMRIGMQYLFNERVTRSSAIDTLVAMSIGAIGASLGVDLNPEGDDHHV
jgi:AcrR family transcriptional regulator